MKMVASFDRAGKALALMLAAAAVARAQLGYDVVDQSSSAVPATGQVEYDCSLLNEWTASRHPNTYPESTARWVEPILVTHSDAYTLFAPGSNASAGLEQYATTGVSTLLFTELVGETAGDISDVSTPTVTWNLAVRDQIDINDVTADAQRPLLSFVSKAFPSPDWFAGLNAFDMRDAAMGTWLSEFTLDLYPWDAGVDSGETYIAADVEEDPQQPVSQLTASNVPQSSQAFLSSDGTTVLPVIRLQCLLQTQTPISPDSPTTSPLPTQSPVETPIIESSAPASATPAAGTPTIAVTGTPTATPAGTVTTQPYIPPVMATDMPIATVTSLPSVEGDATAMPVPATPSPAPISVPPTSGPALDSTTNEDLSGVPIEAASDEPSTVPSDIPSSVPVLEEKTIIPTSSYAPSTVPTVRLPTSSAGGGSTGGGGRDSGAGDSSSTSDADEDGSSASSSAVTLAVTLLQLLFPLIAAAA